MKLLEALEILRHPAPDGAPGARIHLASGITPLHLHTFLSARLRLAWPERTVEITTGRFGDLAGNLERIQGPGEAICAVIEWADLDARLGLRALGRWLPEDIPDIVESAERQANRLGEAMRRLAAANPVYASLPTLPLPPLFPPARHEASLAENRLREMTARMGRELAESGIRLVSAQWLEERVPLARHGDAQAALETGCPYSLEHAATLAEGLARLMAAALPAKGVITDLDDTLWEGIVGEAGSEGVQWSERPGAHLHGLYQRFLGALGAAGTLLAVASKNDPRLAEAALARSDLLIARASLFPVEANWGPKSESVSRILAQWNVAAEDVVFVDDSPLELAEVKARHPAMECLAFPKGNAAALMDLLGRLRDRCGKSQLSAEDAVRLESIRRGDAFRQTAASGDPDVFLRQAEAVITFAAPGPEDGRALELINKTNQFNLNGRRWTRGEWLALLQDPTAFALTAAYEDKFGPLGRIATIAGRRQAGRVLVQAWVVSCRAFSRRIEHQCLRYLFDRFGAEEMEFDFAPTARNAPLQEFFAACLGAAPDGALRLSRAMFNQRSPALFHRVAGAGGETPQLAAALAGAGGAGAKP